MMTFFIGWRYLATLMDSTPFIIARPVFFNKIHDIDVVKYSTKEEAIPKVGRRWACLLSFGTFQTNSTFPFS